MITKYAMVVLAGYSDTYRNKKKEPSLLRELSPFIGAAATSYAGDVLRSKKINDAYNELYPGVVDKDTGTSKVDFDSIVNAFGTINDKYNKLKNDNTRIGKLNYFLAKKLLKNPTRRAQRNLDALNDLKKYDDKSRFFRSIANSHFRDTSEMYSIIKNPKLNALSLGMSKVLPLYRSYYLVKTLFDLGKGLLSYKKNKDKDKIPQKKNKSVLQGGYVS
jgi:hypothetical protein